MTLRLKTVLGVAAIEAVLLGLLIWNSLAFLRESNTGQLEKRARTTAGLFAASVKAEFLTLDLATMESEIELLQNEPGVVWARVVSDSHGVLAERGGRPAQETQVARADIDIDGSKLGWVEVGITDETIAQTLQDAKRNALTMGLSGMALSALFSVALGFYLTRQLSNLARASEAIAGGDFGHRVAVRSNDELGKVAQAFNHMSEELSRSYALLEERIRERTTELAQANEALIREAAERKQAHRDISQILGAVPAMLIGLDGQGRVRRFNRAAEAGFGLAAGDALGRELSSLGLSWDRAKVDQALARCRETLEPVKPGGMAYTRPDGREGQLLLTVSPMANEEGGRDATSRTEGLLLLLEDITDLRALEMHLAHAQRLEAIGQLAAGIAHEINTPTQYVGDSVGFLKTVFADLERLLDASVALAEPQAGASPEEHARRAGDFLRLMEELDYEFLREETPKSFALVQEGVERVRDIVQAMRRFSHPGAAGERKAVDLNSAVQSTLIVSRNEWKYVADAVTDLAPDLPEVSCLPGEINQVLLNIIVNAAHAIADAAKAAARPDDDPADEHTGRITIATRREADSVVISISDTGTGIPEGVRGRIFEPFFTTKEVGKGTGQGLAIAYDIVVNKHGGELWFDTRVGQGTTFHIRLPLG